MNVRLTFPCYLGVKDIGVTFDSSLNFEAHMSEKITKANSNDGDNSTHF